MIAACRKSSAGLAEINGVQVEDGVDVTDWDALRRLGERTTQKVDALWVVAGILRRVALEDLLGGERGYDVIREQLEVNAVGPLRAVAALRGCLEAGSKVALVTSRMGSIADSSGGSYGYRMSKAALNMAGVSLAHDLRGAGIPVMLVHPGWVKTEMTGGTGHLTADESARGLIAQVDTLTLDNSGTFMHQSGEELPW
ncbi:MAG: SDR family oxidoreductase [Myxococcota bacterium]